MVGLMQSRSNRGADFAMEGFATDLRPMPDGSYDSEQLWRFIWDLRFEPDWRREAEIDNAYYDGDQLTQETLKRMAENGIPPVITNLIGPSIDSVSGFETIVSADPKLLPERDEYYETTEAMNVKYKEALRLTQFNSVVNEAFESQIRIGIGWAEVGRDPDPMKYPYAVHLVPWREMWWDYRSRSHNIIDDARFLVRRRWYDADVIKAHFPGSEEAIERARGGFAQSWLNEWDDVGYDDVARSLGSRLGRAENFTLEADEWRQQSRGRTALYEILYKVPEVMEALRFGDGTVIQLNRNSPLHLMALKHNLAQYTKGPTTRWRQAFYCGPTRLKDRALKYNQPHYIPFVCFRRDTDGSVYGLIRRQRSPQESVNARHSRVLYDLSAQKVFIDEDAVEDHDGTADEVNRANAYVILKQDRRNDQGFTLVPSTDTSPITLQLLEQSKGDIFSVTGLYPEFQGLTASADRSGIAIERLVEQTQQVLGKPMRNYRNSKTAAARQLFNLQYTDLSRQNNVAVEVKDQGRTRTVVINAVGADGRRVNDLLLAKMRVALGEVPASATYQQQKFQQLVEIVKSMPPEMQAPLMHLVVRAAVLPESEEIIEILRELTGFGPEPRDPEKRMALQQQQEQMQAMQELVQQLELRIQEAEAVSKEAKAAADVAKAEKLAGADTDMTLAQTDLAEAQTAAELAGIDRDREESDREDRRAEVERIQASAQLESEANAAEQAERDKKAQAASKSSGKGKS